MEWIPGRTNMRWARRMRICLIKTVKAPRGPDAGGTARSCVPLTTRAVDVGCDNGGKTQVTTISFQDQFTNFLQAGMRSEVGNGPSLGFDGPCRDNI
jgi:hypothetical protein